jgi:CheY-like chemotaxis protein
LDNTARKQPKILVVEDEPAIARLFQRVLTGEGYDVAAVANSQMAKEQLIENTYDLLFFDIKLQGQNGKELYHWLNNFKPEEAERVIFSTGDSMSSETQNFLAESGRLTLPKPFTPGQLRDITRQVLGKTTGE